MKPNTLRIEAPQTPNGHRFARRRSRTAPLGAGFFTLGFAVAVLAVASLFAGAVGTVEVSESASATAPAPAQVAGERTQPAAGATTEGEGNVVVSRAPSDSPKQAAGDAVSTQ